MQENFYLDIKKIRQDTPACEKLLHFNNAGSSLMPHCVVDACIEHLRLEQNLGGYEAEAQDAQKINTIYTAAAQLLNAKETEIAYMENATRAWTMAFYSIPFKAGDRILTSVSEYASNYIAFLQVAKRTGARVEVIPNDQYGQTSVQALAEMLDKNVRLVAITHVPTNGGLINPAQEIGDLLKNYPKIFYLLDACQSVGQLPIDVRKIGCHFLSATGRKYLRGPRGTGFLFVSENLPENFEPAILDLHAAQWVSQNEYQVREDAKRFENWETYNAGKIGLGVAVNYALSLGLENISKKVVALAHSLRTKLASIPNITVQDLGLQKCGIVTFSVNSVSLNELVALKEKLKKENINISITLKQYTFTDMQQRDIPELMRASVHYYNTLEEVERFCEVLSRLV